MPISPMPCEPKGLWCPECRSRAPRSLVRPYGLACDFSERRVHDPAGALVEERLFAHSVAATQPAPLLPVKHWRVVPVFATCFGLTAGPCTETGTCAISLPDVFLRFRFPVSLLNARKMQLQWSPVPIGARMLRTSAKKTTKQPTKKPSRVNQAARQIAADAELMRADLDKLLKSPEALSVEALKEVSDRALALIAEKTGMEKRSLIVAAVSVGESVIGLFSRSGGDAPKEGRVRKAWT